MHNRKLKSKKGSVLVITIIVSFLLSISAISIYTIVHRYTHSITSRVENLRDTVYDDGKTQVLPEENGE